MIAAAIAGERQLVADAGRRGRRRADSGRRSRPRGRTASFRRGRRRAPRAVAWRSGRARRRRGSRARLLRARRGAGRFRRAGGGEASSRDAARWRRCRPRWRRRSGRPGRRCRRARAAPGSRDRARPPGRRAATATAASGERRGDEQRPFSCVGTRCYQPGGTFAPARGLTIGVSAAGRHGRGCYSERSHPHLAPTASSAGDLSVKQARVASWLDVGGREAALVQRCAGERRIGLRRAGRRTPADGRPAGDQPAGRPRRGARSLPGSLPARLFHHPPVPRPVEPAHLDLSDCRQPGAQPPPVLAPPPPGRSGVAR